MLSLEQVRAALADSNLRAVARSAGVHENALYRLMWGTTDPRYSTVVRLSEYIKGRDAKPTPTRRQHDANPTPTCGHDDECVTTGGEHENP